MAKEENINNSKKKATKEIKIDFGSLSNKDGKNKGKGKFNIGWIYGAIFVALIAFNIFGSGNSAEQITYTMFNLINWLQLHFLVVILT